MGDEPGRIWDAIVHNGTIFVLELHNDSKVHWYGHLPEHHYSLYVSTDNGRTFRPPIPTTFLSENTHTGVPNRLLIQASHAYAADKTNVMHWWLR